MIKKTICITSPSYLKTKDRQLHIVNSENNELRGKIPIEDIGYLILEHPQITISHPLISLLLENNSAIITCNNQHMPTGMFLNLDGNTIQSERFKAQIEASEPLKKQLWQQTIRAKIENQKKVMNIWGLESDYLQVCKNNVKSGDSDNQEAKASYYYWRRLFELEDGFKRERYGDPPNQLLNYGYSILRSVIARALTGSGLLPTLGIFHKNKYNAYCLADDIMEPYRPFVDNRVKLMLYHSMDIEADISRDQKNNLLQIPAMDVVIDGEKHPLMIAAQRTSSSLARCFTGEIKKLIYPEFK
ncbi:MAG: type II CRISPR-associated endonuclease Cas1 [Saprospiraceae bacterium]|nr:type II CRISPR-associated endonuclease Cas1 [Saprospiraceae bacterium]